MKYYCKTFVELTTPPKTDAGTVCLCVLQVNYKGLYITHKRNSIKCAPVLVSIQNIHHHCYGHSIIHKIITDWQKMPLCQKI